jgi:hypothetical protein
MALFSSLVGQAISLLVSGRTSFRLVSGVWTHRFGYVRGADLAVCGAAAVLLSTLVGMFIDRWDRAH